MDRFTVTGIDVDGTPLFLHIEAKCAQHAESVLRAVGLGSSFLLLNGHVSAADGRKAYSLVEYLRNNGGLDSEPCGVLQEYLDWYNHPARGFSSEISTAQLQAIGELGKTAGLTNTRLLEGDDGFTVLHTANPNTCFQTDRMLGLLKPDENVWQVCLYRPKNYLEKYGTTSLGYRVVSEHRTPELAMTALLKVGSFEQDVQRQPA